MESYSQCALVLHWNTRKSRSVQYLFGPFAGLVKVSSAVQGPLYQLVPAGLYAQQQVLDQNHVLLEAGEAQLGSSLLQCQDLFSVGVHLIHKHLGRQSKRELKRH